MENMAIKSKSLPTLLSNNSSAICGVTFFQTRESHSVEPSVVFQLLQTKLEVKGQIFMCCILFFLSSYECRDEEIFPTSQ